MMGMEPEAGGEKGCSLEAQRKKMLQHTAAAGNFLSGIFLASPEIVVILGTGIGGGFAGKLEAPTSIAYKEIPYFPQSTVPGHAGKLVAGTLHGRQVAVLQGRFHFYEGYSSWHLTLPLRVLSLLGAKSLVVCNVAGGLNPSFSPGALMLLRDHLNFIPDNPLRGPNIDAWGPRFPDMSCTYDSNLRKFARRKAAALGLGGLEEGVYVAVPGPSLETPAETKYLRNCGADAVGMSTVPEVIVARHAGMRVLGLSVIANVNNPEQMMPILLEEVLAEAAKASASLENLLLAMFEEWPVE